MTPKTGTFLFGAVVAGVLAFGARAAEGDSLDRITFTASGTMNCIQLSEIAVYDFSKNRLNSKMTDAGVGSSLRISSRERMSSARPMAYDFCTANMEGKTYPRARRNKTERPKWIKKFLRKPQGGQRCAESSRSSKSPTGLKTRTVGQNISDDEVSLSMV